MKPGATTEYMIKYGEIGGVSYVPIQKKKIRATGTKTDRTDGIAESGRECQLFTQLVQPAVQSLASPSKAELATLVLKTGGVDGELALHRVVT